MSGPYRTEAEAAAELMPREVRDLHDAGRVRSGDPDRLVRDTVLQHLLTTCYKAGVEIGDYDRRVLTWLAGWEPATVQVVIGLLERAQATKERTKPMTDTPVPPPEDIYRAVAVAQAIRWGYTKTLSPGELADFIRKQATDDNVRADADEVWHYAQRVFGRVKEGTD